MCERADDQRARGLAVNRLFNYGVLRVALGILLLTSAGLKTHQLATEPILGDGALHSRGFLAAVVEFELFFGVWLLRGLLPRFTWLVSLGCFGVFACMSAFKALSAESSCGCFGRVAINPWYTATLDLAIVLSLLPLRPRQFLFCVRRAIAVTVLSMVIGIPAAYAMAGHGASALFDGGDIIGDDAIVLLEPETWIGKRFWLLGYIDIGDKLNEGKWLVLLYHHSCNKCQNAIKHLRKTLRASGLEQVVLIEMPPYADSEALAGCPGVNSAQGRLDISRVKEWFAETPILLESHDGYIVRIRNPDQPESEA